MEVVAEEVGEKIEVRLNAYWQHEMVLDIRRLGAWAAIELRDPGTGAALARGLKGAWTVAPALSRSLLEVGCAAARRSPGLLHIAPPLVATDEDLDFVGDAVGLVLDALAATRPCWTS